MKHARITIVAVLAALALTACGTGSPFQPTGILTVTFAPSNAAPETTLWGANYKRIGDYTGDFAATLPAGTVHLTAIAEGYDALNLDVALSAGEHKRVDLLLTESLKVSYSYFSVSRYATATLTLTGLTAANYSGALSLRASCIEDGYGSLTTYLRGQVVVTTGVPITAYLSHSSGFPYFTGNVVRCSMYAQATDRAEARIAPR